MSLSIMFLIALCSYCLAVMASSSSPQVSVLVEEVLEDREVAPTTTVASLLSTLRHPQPSELARKRRVPSNPPTGKRKGKGSVSFNPKSVTPSDRVKLYVHLGIHSTLKKLFCKACREPLSLKKSVIDNHCKAYQ